MTIKDNSKISSNEDGMDLREAMRYWATGVCVVTSHHEGVDHGMTVNSFTSVSVEPPLITVALERTARTHGMVQSSQTFGITILSSEQEEVSNRFAGRDTENEDRFSGYEKERLGSSNAFIKGGLAYLDCRVHSSQPVGPNTLFIAEVISLQVNLEVESREPLLYYSRDYHRLN